MYRAVRLFDAYRASREPGVPAPEKIRKFVANPMDSTTIPVQTSDSVVVTGSVGVQGQTSTFADTTIIDISSPAAPVISATASEFNDDNISGFFKRPLLINTFTWPSTTAQGVQIQNLDPWYLYLSSAIVQRKTANYYKISGEMVLEVVVQAAPTMYGHAVVQLIPQGTELYGGDYTIGDGVNTVSMDVLPTIWQSTQDIYGDIVPATSETLEFRLPWISPIDAFQLDQLSNTGPLGGGPQTQWRFLTHCLVPLRNATNMASIGEVTIRVYARIENVKLSIPLTLQTGEKKHKKQGTVGKIAGAVTSVASALKGVPFVGEIAAGVEVVSSAIGAVADWFGFTRVTSVAIPGRVRQEVFPGLANADGTDTSCPLSILEGNKVSIDPALFGSGGTDIESFDDLFRRKTLVGIYSWATTAAAGTVLATIPVCPSYCHSVLSTDYIVYPTPVAMVSTMFLYWRGPMYYEIQVRCSSLHRGMLQIVYHPSLGNDTSDPTNTSYNRTFEIEADGVHTFRVGWAQNTLWKKCQPDLFTSGVLSEDNNNGFMDIRIFTKLTAPDPAALVAVEVYAFSDGNMTFMGPIPPATGLTLQSGMSSAMMTEMANLVGDQAADEVDITAIGGGERIQSLRTLLQRPFPQVILTSAGVAALGELSCSHWTLPLELRWEYGVGSWDLFGYTNTPAVNWTPMTWFPQMFLGWRGSLRSKFVLFQNQNGEFNTAIASNVTNFTSSAGTNIFDSSWFVNGPYALSSGFSETNVCAAGSLEVVSPFYQPWRYKVSRVTQADNSCDQQIVALMTCGTTYETTAADRIQAVRYHSAGSDFSLGRFRFVPRLMKAA